MKPVIGVVVPALTLGGGLPAVADFLCTQIEKSGRYELRLFSLGMSSRDECSVRIMAPRTWRRGLRFSTGAWNNRPYTHYGAFAAEIEFQRYQPREALSADLKRCDLIQVVAGSPAAALPTAGLGRPVVLQVATRVGIERASALSAARRGPRLWRRLMTAMTAQLDDRAIRCVDAVMVENEHMLRYARGLRDTSRAAAVKAPPGVDSQLYAPPPGGRPPLDRDPYILFVGRMADPRKNIHLLCAAYADLRVAVPSAPRLVVAGQGDLPTSAVQLLKARGAWDSVQVIQAPSSAQLTQLYQRALCVALPSTEEGFGMVLIEAMSCGVPVVATRCGGPEEIVVEGETGFLVPIDDTRALAGRMRELCGDRALNERMGRNARTTVLARFAAEIAFRPFLEAYERLLERRLPA